MASPITYYGEKPCYGDAVLLQFDAPASHAAAAGVYTATIKVPGRSILTNVGLTAVALWNAGTSATGKIGDGDDDDGFFIGIDLKTATLAGESLSFSGHGGVPGAYIVGTLPTGHWEATYDADDRTLTCTITTVGTAPTTGKSIFWATWIRVPEAAPGGVLRQNAYVAT